VRAGEREARAISVRAHPITLRTRVPDGYTAVMDAGAPDNRPAATLTIALAQLNAIVGDVDGNAEKARRARAEAAALGADLVLFPELSISGYPPEDLVLKPAFVAACRAAVEALARESADGPALLVGTPWREG